MAEFPLAGHSEALSKLLSSVLPPRTYGYLVLFLPGFFFELSISLANPQFVQQLIAKSNQAANLGRYPKILVAVFLAFVIGNAFMLWVGVVHRTLARVFGVCRFLWERFCAWPLLPILNRLMAPQGWVSRRGPRIQFLMHAKIFKPVHATANDLDDLTSAGARRLWARLTKSLFEKHYGINLSHLEQEEWNALYEASAGVPRIAFTDHMLLTASQGLGWSGLASTRFAPSLINRNYLAFNLFLIAVGMFYEWWLIRGQYSEHVYGLAKVRALLRELRKGRVTRTESRTKTTPTDTDTGTES